MRICTHCSELYPDDAGFCPLDGKPLVASTDPFLGRTIASRYRLVKKIGQGGMSVVYLARHVMIERMNAIKILRQDLTLDPNHRERFLREARAVNRINHPNIVEITDFGEIDGMAFLVMEYAEGEPLLTTIQRGTLPWDRAARMAKQIAGALARAHEAGVIHRDLKPENILVLKQDDARRTEDQLDRVKLTDFGIAKILDAPALTFSEQMFGTPGYIAPEVVEGLKVDGRADLYALGVVLYEMICGKLPFDGKTQAELLLKPLTTPPIPLSQRTKDVPPEIESLVLSMLAKDPKDRPPDAFAVEHALAEALRKYEGKPAVSSGEQGREETFATVEEHLPEPPPRETANLGRLQTSEMASRWSAAIAEARSSIAVARQKNRPAENVARAEELVLHAERLVANIDRASRAVAELQGRVDAGEAHAREFRKNLGTAIDVLGRDRSRERAHLTALRERRDELEIAGGPQSATGTGVWEIAAIGTEEDRARAIEEDLTFQIVQLQIQLEAKNERYEKEHAMSTAELEGSISAVRAMTSELVRTLDEAAGLFSRRK
jgi:eukaryotic-like serine/threonine-protein kinase